MIAISVGPDNGLWHTLGNRGQLTATQPEFILTTVALVAMLLHYEDVDFAARLHGQ